MTAQGTDVAFRLFLSLGENGRLDIKLEFGLLVKD